MKNHFYISYAGNKRTEVEKLYNLIKDKINENTVIIEPYCGSCALSYYIWLLHPNIKFKLNDMNPFLFDMYNLLKNDTKIKQLEKYYNEKITKITKEEYNLLIKDTDIKNQFLKNKFYSIRQGLYPTNKTFSSIKLKNYPIYKFFNEANIIYTNKDALEIIEEEKNNENNIIFLDPPYISTCNKFYDYETTTNNVYEYLFKNNINNYMCLLVGIFEKNWIIDLLFSNNIISTYNKLYQTSKKKTEHIIISNKEINIIV
jgi:16S rRNA G966 N2-methylase RsmD